MATLFSELIKQIIFYLVFGVGVIGGLNFWTKGFLLQWFRVKSSRDKLLLVKIRNVMHDYYRPGVIDGKSLKFKTANGKERLLAIPDGSIYRSMGIFMINVDEEKSCVDARDFSKVSGFDAETIANLQKRALTAPKLEDNMTKAIIICLVFIIIGLIVLGIMSYSWHGETLKLINGLKDVATTSGVSPVSGGV